MLPDDLAAVRDRAEQLYGPDEISTALDHMAKTITAELANTMPVVLCNLTGAILPTGHLLTRLDFPLEIDHLHVTRYRGDTTGGDRIDWLGKPRILLTGRTVLLIDDILDEGHTLNAVIDYCRKEGAERVYSAVLVKKHHERGLPVVADCIGLEVDDRYVFGFGMDYKGWFRNLNGIYAVNRNKENT
ncbi:MAG: hypoxanthine-guanine phosphoribosyltransferase [Thiohalobacterales bacterium]